MKPIIGSEAPKTVTIFGASGHIGGPCARFIRFFAPEITLRLVSTSDQKLASLREEFPDAEVIKANYLDPASLDEAIDGAEATLVLTTQPMQERGPMENLVAAVRKAGSVKHMIRVVGLLPERDPRRIPQSLRDFGMGLEVQHAIARQVLDDAEMPVTYLNIGASFMDNFLRMIPGIRATGAIVWPLRRIPYVDPREVGEVAARLFLSGDPGHLYQFYTLNNGEPSLTMAEVAEMMTEVFLKPVRHDASRESFDRVFQARIDAGVIHPDLGRYIWNMVEDEESNAYAWNIPNGFMKMILGRRPNTLRAWLHEHRQHFFP